jgi:hypothetical protein
VSGTCGCCKGFEEPPPLVYNRPGLSDIEYRIGTFSTFLQSMLANISRVKVKLHGMEVRPFVERSWTTRDSADQGIATLEMFAYVAHVLTFYQETTANEAFLRTATLRESVLAMAATLGYVPAPGQAAVALLAFTLEKKRQLQIPVGLRVQSVPEPPAKPQKFETVESIAADALLNAARVFPPAQSVDALATGRTSADLLRTLSLKKPVVAGSQVVVFGMSSTAAEDKEVVSVREADGRTRIEWAPPVGAGGVSARMFQWTAKLRLAGQNAPASFLVPTVNSPTDVTFELETTDFTIEDTATSLNLDAIYPDLKAGQQVLIRAPETVVLRTLTDVVEETDTSGGLVATVSQIQFNPSIGSDVADRRKVSVYVLGEELLFEPQGYADEIASGASTVFLESTNPRLVPKRTVILDDVSASPLSTTITSVAASGGGALVTFTPALSRPLDMASAIAYGNVASATHGETVKNEVLGNGDASATFQRFKLAKSPVTFVPKPGAEHGAASTLVVRVDGVTWKEVPSFYGLDGKQRVYTTRRDEKEVMTIQFGDGVTGARLTSGRGNVTATYRHGVGVAGNLNAGAIKNPLDRPTGLRAAFNPLPSSAGTDPEPLDAARDNAPNTVRTFGRIVSLRDFEDQAREFNGVAKALAVSAWDGEEQVVFLTVAGDGGVPLTQQTLDNLVADFGSRRDINRTLHVIGHKNVPVQASVGILVDPDFVPEDVQTAAQAALVDLFAFDRVDLGRAIHLSDVFAAVQAVAGVTACDVNLFQYKNAADATSHGATTDAVQPHLRMFRDELPSIQDPALDAAITLGMP